MMDNDMIGFHGQTDNKPEVWWIPYLIALIVGMILAYLEM
jgi:hypothetical protein